MTCTHWVDERVDKIVDGDEVDETNFKKKIGQLLSLPMEFVCAQITEHLGWTTSELNFIWSYDEQAPYHVLAAMLNCSLTLKLPPQCQNETVAAHVARIPGHGSSDFYRPVSSSEYHIHTVGSLCLLVQT